MTLTTDDVERVAQRAAELMRDELAALLEARVLDRATGFVDAHTVASALNVSRGFVYEHATELGGRRIAGGPKAPWRFDLSAAIDAHAQPPPSPAPTMQPSRPRRPSPTSVPLLPIRGSVNGR